MPVVVDQTGLVESCAQPDVTAELDGAISVSNPFEDNAVQVEWRPGNCDGAIQFTFSAFPQGDPRFGLFGLRPKVCADGPGSPRIYIRFKQTMPADSVIASLSDEGMAGICRYAQTEIQIAPAIVSDDSGTVESCFAADSPLPFDNAMPVLENTSDSNTKLQVHWAAGPCETDTSVTFSRNGDRYSLVVDRGEADCEAVVNRRVGLNLTEPIEASLVDVDIVVTRPCTGAFPMTVTDHTGSVASCKSSDPDQLDNLPESPHLTNPNGDQRVLQAVWSTSGCITSAGSDFAQIEYPDSMLSPQHLPMFNLRITEVPAEPGCFGPLTVRGFEITFRRPVTPEMVAATVGQR